MSVAASAVLPSGTTDGLAAARGPPSPSLPVPPPSLPISREGERGAAGGQGKRPAHPDPTGSAQRIGAAATGIKRANAWGGEPASGPPPPPQAAILPPDSP